MLTQIITIVFLFAIVLASPTVFADGVMRSIDPSYPDNLLKHTSTQVTVTLHGQIAETEVFCEFINEWDRKTDAVFSFPLPMEASASQMSYSKGMLLYDAVLKPSMQSNNPGTGSGGFAAELNSYLGKNSVNLRIDKIPAHGTQSIYLKYVERLPFFNGLVHYRYPMKTGAFLPEPLSVLGMTVRVWEGGCKPVFQSQSHPDGWNQSSPDTLWSVYKKESSKTYLNEDWLFTVDMKVDHFRAELFSTMGKDNMGHFAFSLYPEQPTSRTDILDRSVVFLLDISRSMSGFKLEESCEAIKSCLSGLESRDSFAIAAFSDKMELTRGMVPADSMSKAVAIRELDSISTITGPSSSQLALSLNSALSLFSNNGRANLLVACTDGFSPCTPRDIVNPSHASIFAVGLGAEVSRARLEAVTYANNGFPIFLNNDDPIKDKMAELFEVLKNPLISSFNIDFATAIATELLPDANPFMFFSGLGYFITGRFSIHGTHNAILTGHTVSGDLNDLLSLDFRSDTAEWDGLFVEQLWASEKIKAWEREIEIYDKAGELRDSVMRISLAYGIKSQYTSFSADDSSKPADSLYKDPEPGSTTSTQAKLVKKEVLALSAYPNPFNPLTSISFTCPGMVDGETIFSIYSLDGKLVRKIVARLVGSRAEFSWDGRDFSGNRLGSGIYVGRIQANGKIAEIRMLFAK